MRNTAQRLTAGELQHSVTIQAPAGVVAVAAVDVETGVPAAISVTPPQFQSREALNVGGLQTATQYLVSLRYRTDVVASYVLLEDCCTQRRFQILSVVPSDRRDAVDLLCVTNG
jgi:hypothetical protein